MPGVNWNSFTTQMPEWMAEELTSHNLLPAGTQAEISEFSFADAQALTLVGAATAGSGVTLTINAALKSDINKGVILDFGSGKLATLDQKAVRGTTTLTVTLAANTVDGDSYPYPGSTGRTVVPSGTLVGRTYAERDAGTGFGIADVANDDEIYLVAYQNEYVEQDAGVTLVRHNTLVYENKLPGWATMTAAQQAAIRQRYQTITYPN
ncbi:MAG: hypothetical protein AAGA83_22735 [Cyanobacteria bacterium P01_F01_bin.116]